ncbi:hypothetical protein [Deinococcus sp. UYEF24]
MKRPPRPPSKEIPFPHREKQETEQQAAKETRTTQQAKEARAAQLGRFTVGLQCQYRKVNGRIDLARQNAFVTVVRGPNLKAEHPSIRVKFADDVERSVPPGHLWLIGETPEALPQEPVPLTDARRRPSWARLVQLIVVALDEHETAEADRPEVFVKGSIREALPGPELREAEQRARQLTGMVLPKNAPEWEETAALLFEAAIEEAKISREKRPGRAGHVPLPPERYERPSTRPNTERLDQEARALINTIATCITRRYFLSDAEQRPQLDQRKRQQAAAIRVLIRGSEEEVGGGYEERRQPRGHPVQQFARESYLGAYREFVAAGMALLDGKPEDALLYAAEGKRHRENYLVANSLLEKDQPEIMTGRWTHGEYLSVREYDEKGGFKQWYVRVVFVYAEDAITLTVANPLQLENLGGVEVGDNGWRDLCRWVLDNSPEGGKQQGRPQGDDRTMVYRDRGDGDPLEAASYKLRDGLTTRYPGLVRALDCIRRAMVQSLPELNPEEGELPEGKPEAGYHAPPPKPRPKEPGGLDKNGQKSA